MLPFLSSKKIVSIIVLVILIQIAWAGWTLYNRDQPGLIPQDLGQGLAEKKAQNYATLTASSNEVNAGERFTVDISVYGVSSTDGADLVIAYDPKLLAVTQKPPVQTGNMYEEYPLNQTDETSGKIYVSGVVSQRSGIVPQGSFGLITFTAKTAGTANIAFDFTPGQSTDSNLVEITTHKDILEKVENIQVIIK